MGRASYQVLLGAIESVQSDAARSPASLKIARTGCTGTGFLCAAAAETRRRGI
jgi:hypothetical protein